MIRYALSCSKGHPFEAWFRSAEDFDRQQEGGLLACPSCGDTSVAKALMAPAVVSRGEAQAVIPDAQPETAPLPVAAPGPVPLPPEAEAMIARLRELKAKLLENSEDVGRGFAEEARRIHFGEAPLRAVHGQASQEDAASLIEEGVEIMQLPVLPEDRN
jgi:hypothetical protein